MPIMKLLLAISFVVVFCEAICQNGYVCLKSGDSTIVGYVRRYKPEVAGAEGIEVWRDKKDRQPLRIPKTAIAEFAINTDTFRILHQFRPFQEVQAFYEYIEAKIVSRGRVTLLVITNYPDPGSVSNYTGGGIIPEVIDHTTGASLKKVMGFHSKMYVLEDTNGRDAVAPDKAALKETLLDYFPDRFVEKYFSKFGEVTYKTLDDMVRFYNSK